MMKEYFRCVILIIFIGTLGFAQQPNETVKIMTYNIWNGYDFGKDENRRAKLVDWVNSQNITIVGLQELVNYTPEKLKEDAKNWGRR